MIRVSVIIISYNNSHNISDCIDSAINQNYNTDAISLEIIVIDSGSTDKSTSILNKYKHKYINKLKVVFNTCFTKLSPAEARNVGVSNSNGDILIFTDGDCVMSLNHVSKVVDIFRNYNIDAVFGSRDPDLGNGLGTFIRKYDFILYSSKYSFLYPLMIDKERLKRGAQLVLLSGNNFAVKNNVWKKIGGMKTLFKNPAGEDILMEAELINGDYKILFHPDINIIHSHSIGFWAFMKKTFYRGEAVFLLSRYSNNIISWRDFIKRGHIFHPIRFILYLLFISILFSIIITNPFYCKGVCFFIVIFVLMAIFVFSFFKTRRKLKFKLVMKNERNKKVYMLSLSQLFIFCVIHFFMRIIALVGFYWYFFFFKNK